MTIEPVPLEAPGSDREQQPGSDAGDAVESFAPAAPVARPWLRWALPLMALAIGAGIFALLFATRHRPETRDVVPPSPLVRVAIVEPEDLRLSVTARGTVMPRTESDLVAEVRGRVVWVAPELVVGGLFEQGDELLRLDDREYRIARDRARATVQLRESEARLATADAERRRQLSRRGAASAADLEQFENREFVAKASLAEARASLEQAELDYERTVVRAPFDGRVRERSVDVGRFVSPGTKLGRVFAVDYAEVRLPIQTDDLAFLDIDLSGPGRGAVDGARVALTGRLGGREFVWPARLDRAEAAIDERTRMLFVVARIDDPYALKSAPAREAPAAADAEEGPDGARPASVTEGPGAEVSSRVPLPSGLFVTAEIEGRPVSDVFVLPMMALRDGDRVFVAEPLETPEAGVGSTVADADADRLTGATRGRQGLLRIREVSVLRRDREQVVIEGGLEAGDHVVISPLRIYSEGMLLRLVEAEDP